MKEQILNLEPLIYNTWKGKNFSIPEYIFKTEIIAKFMHQISQNSPYTSSYSQLEKFCYDSMFGNNENYFCSVFIYILNNTIVGFLNVRITFSDAEIDFICVDSEYQRKHIAEKMFQFFEDFVLKEGKISKIFLEVGMDNLPAVAFYEKKQFKKISIRKKYYKNNEDALIMCKKIEDTP